MALGARPLATPRYSTTRGHSVLRQGFVPSSTLSPVGGLRVTPGSGNIRGFRAASEPPFRGVPGSRRVLPRRNLSPIPHRRADYYDDAEHEYATSLSLHNTSAAARDCDDIYNSSRARDRALLSSANNAVANASVTPIANRRVASRIAAKSSPGSRVAAKSTPAQVDHDPDYKSPLYAEFDIEPRSMQRNNPKSSPGRKPVPKMGSRAVGARARVNLKRNQLIRRGSPVATSRNVVVASVYVEEPITPERSIVRAMSVPPLSTIKKRVVRRAMTPAANRPTVNKQRVSMYETGIQEPTSGQVTKRRVITQGAREGAPYGNVAKGRATAIVLSQGKKYRHLRDYKTTPNTGPLYFDLNEGAISRPIYLTPSLLQRRRIAAGRRATPSAVIVLPPETSTRKAALLAPTVEIERRKRTPKSKFGASKMREIDLISRDSAVAGLHASAPGARVKEGRRAIRTDDGYTQPTSVMSWKNRVDSRLDNEDDIYVPSSLNQLKNRLRTAKDQMDSHRQLLDRFLDTDVMAKSNSSARVSKIRSPDPVITTRREVSTTVVTEEGD